MAIAFKTVIVYTQDKHSCFILSKEERLMRNTMTTVVKPWGNSHGIRLSKEIMTAMDIHANDSLSLDIVGDSIIIKKTITRKTLPEYASAFGGRLGPYEEFDWGDGIGIERWLNDED